jgi:spore maturation protein CgeB
MDIDYRLFDLSAHIAFFNHAFGLSKEHAGINYSPDALHFYSAAPLLQVVSEFEPDLVLTINSCSLPKPLVVSIQKMGASVVLWAVNDPYNIERTINCAGVYDYIFTVETAAVNLYRECGCDVVHQLPLAAHPKIFKRLVEPQFKSDICIVAPSLSDNALLINDVVEYAAECGLLLKILSPGVAHDDKLPVADNGNFLHFDTVAAHPADAARYYANAAIVVNVHRAPDVSAMVNGSQYDLEALSPHGAIFEVAASGGFQLIDNSRPELYRHFDIGSEVDTFASTDELIKKIDLYLGNEQRRAEMARNAKERVLREHTFNHRLEFILDKTVKRNQNTILTHVISTPEREHPYIGVRDGALKQKMSQLLVQAVSPEAKRVLDIGCGEGMLGEMLKSVNMREVVGVEVNDNLATQARDRLDRVIVGDIEEVELPFKNGYFDCIIYDNVLECLKDPRRLISRQRRFLTADGQLIASVSNNLYFPVIKELLGGRARYRATRASERAGSVRFFTLREVAHMFKWAGYEILAVEGIEGERIDEDEAHAFMKKLKTLNIVPESLEVECRYAQYLVVARKALTDAKQGVSLSLVKAT